MLPEARHGCGQGQYVAGHEPWSRLGRRAALILIHAREKREGGTAPVRVLPLLLLCPLTAERATCSELHLMVVKSQID